MEKRKLIHLEIISCDVCPYRKMVPYAGGAEVCMRHDRRNRIYPLTSGNIPDWCPLPDAKENNNG